MTEKTYSWHYYTYARIHNAKFAMVLYCARFNHAMSRCQIVETRQNIFVYLGLYAYNAHYFQACWKKHCLYVFFAFHIRLLLISAVFLPAAFSSTYICK